MTRAEAIEVLRTESIELGGSAPSVCRFLEALDMAVKALDAVPVVRCRECKYHNKPPCPMKLSFNWTEDDDFCSYGEEEGADNGM